MTSEQFKKIRIQLGLTQGQLAEKMGVLQQDITRIEKGMRITRCQETLLKHIAKYEFNIDCGEDQPIVLAR